MSAQPLMQLKDLEVHFPLRSGLFGRPTRTVKAVNKVSLRVERGAAVGIVGESGSGKSTLVRTMMRLGRPTSGSIAFRGEDITSLPEAELRPLRRHMQMVFQDTKSSLDPSMRISQIVAEPMTTHGVDASRDRILDLLQQVGLGEAHVDRFPHQLSGGQRQRVGIARVLGVSPELVVADEPVSALDVSIQAQILNLLRKLREDRGIAFVLISHDMSVVNYFCTEVGVMYLGSLMEYGAAREVIRAPAHPYTQSLVSAVPGWTARTGRPRTILRGETPSAVSLPAGCPFHTRFLVNIGPVCENVTPPKYLAPHGGWSACHLLDGQPVIS